MDRHKKQRRAGLSGYVPAAIYGTPPTTPKRVPRTPNNTPEPEMAEQTPERVTKRHLVRWNDPMDKKLLLAIQYACNTSGVTVPWDRVGAIMGPEITSGAVIQHLAKVRVRLVEDGLPVPPPLRRGGSGRNTIAAPTPKKKNCVNNALKAKVVRKKAEPKSESSSNEQSDWKNPDSDSDFGTSSAKRTKSKAKASKERIIKKDVASDEDAAEDTNDQLIAAGAGFLALEGDGSPPKTANNTPSAKKSLIVALPGAMGAIKDEDTDMSANEREAEATGGLVVPDQSYENFSSSPYNDNFANLAAAQMEPATGPINTSSYGGSYNNLHTSPQVSGFNGIPYRTHQSLFQQAGDDVDFNLCNPGAQVPIDFNSDAYLKQAGVYDTMTNVNGTYNGSTQQSDFAYQPTNAYHESPAVFDNNHHDHLPLTHWSNDNSFAGSSMATTANQTPAENSAGTDFGGYFTTAQFQPNAFDGEAYDPSASHSTGSLNTAYVPDVFNNEYYGNGSYLD